MIDHMSSYSTDYPAAKSFYEAALSALGYGLNMEMVAEWDADFPTRRACAFGPGDNPIFWVIEVKQENAATPRHTAFVAQDRAAVSAFYDAAMGSGGSDNGAPGLRPIYHEHYYGAFVFDPDGNNVEAVCHAPEG